MFKIIVTIVLTILSLLFIIQNFDYVPVYFFWGKAFNIRLFFVIAISGAIGYIIRLFIGIGREEKLKKKIYLMKKQMNKAKKRTNGIEEEFSNDELSI
ncbi:MAG: LapA family protein [Desulfobacterales bacterium]|nr:LapA family protein [Desulfobacterales bacterium]